MSSETLEVGDQWTQADVQQELIVNTNTKKYFFKIINTHPLYFKIKIRLPERSGAEKIKND